MSSISVEVDLALTLFGVEKISTRRAKVSLESMKRSFANKISSWSLAYLWKFKIKRKAKKRKREDNSLIKMIYINLIEFGHFINPFRIARLWRLYSTNRIIFESFKGWKFSGVWIFSENVYFVLDFEVGIWGANHRGGKQEQTRISWPVD